MSEPLTLDFSKAAGLVPAIIVDDTTNQVLMLGFMNEEAFNRTMETKLVTFFSRSRNTLWVKGETSGNFLDLVSYSVDCDNDTLLVRVNPRGPVCHTGAQTCFNDRQNSNVLFLQTLSDVINQRKRDLPEGSYTAKLFQRGADRIIQKVGEEAVETVIAAKNRNKEEIKNEASDLLFHLLVLFAEQDIDLQEVIGTLIKRHK
jgi:phosphoribosyl-ATP pyrophosphohydrolase/phosphoribosyl-AMP cyclohydrolase